MQGHLKLPEIQNNNLMKAHLKLHDTNVTIKKGAMKFIKVAMKGQLRLREIQT